MTILSPTFKGSSEKGCCNRFHPRKENFLQRVFPKGKIRVYYEDSFLGMADQVEGSEEIKAHKVFHTEI